MAHLQIEQRLETLGGQSIFHVVLPEAGDLFGAAVAHVAAAIIAQSAPRILEFGAGTGRLAEDILREMAALGVEVATYSIVDLSGELRARQQERLRGFPQVRWLERLADASGRLVWQRRLGVFVVAAVLTPRPRTALAANVVAEPADDEASEVA